MPETNTEVFTQNFEKEIPYNGEGLLISWGPDTAALGGGTMKIETKMGNTVIDQEIDDSEVKGEWPINPNIPSEVIIVVTLSGSTDPALELNYAQGGS